MHNLNTGNSQLIFNVLYLPRHFSPVVSSCQLHFLTQVLLSENLNYSWATCDRPSQNSHQTGKVVKCCWILCFQMQNKITPVSFRTLIVRTYTEDARRVLMDVFLSLRELSSHMCYAEGYPSHQAGGMEAASSLQWSYDALLSFYTWIHFRIT